MVNIPISVVSYMLLRAVLAKRTRILEKCYSIVNPPDCVRTLTGLRSALSLPQSRFYPVASTNFLDFRARVHPHGLFSLTGYLSPHAASLSPLFLPLLYAIGRPYLYIFLLLSPESSFISEKFHHTLLTHFISLTRALS